MEVHRLGAESELKPPAYTTATAMPDPSRVCELHLSSWQCQILNPLSEARDRTRNLMVPSRICFRCATTGTPPLTLLSAATRWASWASISGKVSAFCSVCCSFCLASSSHSANWRLFSSLWGTQTGGGEELGHRGHSLAPIAPPRLCPPPAGTGTPCWPTHSPTCRWHHAEMWPRAGHSDSASPASWFAPPYPLAAPAPAEVIQDHVDSSSQKALRVVALA